MGQSKLDAMPKAKPPKEVKTEADRERERANRALRAELTRASKHNGKVLGKTKGRARTTKSKGLKEAEKKFPVSYLLLSICLRR